MRKVNGLKVYSQEELFTEKFGKKGTPKRNKFDEELDKALKKAKEKLFKDKPKKNPYEPK